MTTGADDRTHWRWWFLLAWAVIAAWLLHYKWNAIHWFALSDTDDNMRFAQVRALIDGQGWYDLRQHRVDPPAGISIHWSRLVDLPIAALMLLIRPVAGGAEAARWACALAPLLPLGLGLYATMLTARRLVDQWAFLLAAAIVACAQTTMLMWMPLRIDHHGWQLATLAVAVSGMADPKRLRGGLTAGLATAVSLTIGLELLPYLAVTGALIALWWAIDVDQRERLRGYGAALAAGTALGYVLFGSFDNAQMLCDALTPVYLSTLLAAGGICVALGSLPIADRRVRLAALVVAGAAIGAGYALAFPQCLGRPERVSPELEKIWLSHVREAKPLYQHSWRVWFPTISLSAIGVIGAAATLWRERATPRAMPWLLVLLLSIFSALLLLWQTRAGPASQLMGVIGATALGWPLMRWTFGHRWMAVRVLGTVTAFLFVSGAFAGLIVKNVPEKKPQWRQRVDTANRRCPTLPALKPIAALPPQTILTFIDLGPRIVAVTRHDVIAAPYHRAGDAILDVQYAFRSTDPETAHRTMLRHKASLLLICPGLSESTVYGSEAPKGFYVQLVKGQVPTWLAPVTLPAGSPFKLWRLIG
ncbi:AcrB/AcrD/AcrF family protein [Sphingomonas nostoxanthinifaciens]|uniref:AcrB/AcrD/AcrF family protein n=1 Tax=Sphingomonas nostoxanthinifaciens TaxID=2872652 RepID=UPI001CC20D4B|nr:AcrB/AcrD/AcrF family protein [Sphingomonas nostoxanthinifaciens]UAK24494.1 AcrB/AcrD/AcrF family protein [Sphingomonas nostoxanthinifaciens]